MISGYYYIAWSVATISHDQWLLYRMISGFYIAWSVATISHDQLLYHMISYYITWSAVTISTWSVTISHDQRLLYHMISSYYIYMISSYYIYMISSYYIYKIEIVDGEGSFLWLSYALKQYIITVTTACLQLGYINTVVKATNLFLQCACNKHADTGIPLGSSVFQYLKLLYSMYNIKNKIRLF